MTSQSNIQTAELLSDPLVFLSSSQNWDSGIDFDAIKFDRRGYKRKHVELGELGPEDSVNGLLEDILQEPELDRNAISSEEQYCIASQVKKPKTLPFDGFGGNWDHSEVFALSPELKPEVEASDHQNTMPKDLTKLLSNHPSSAQAISYSVNEDITDWPSSVLTDDTLDFNMQQIALMFPVTTDHDKTIGISCWDNLPGMC